jgi:U4/U6.U5 tri-snRNP-associated protein 1
LPKLEYTDDNGKAMSTKEAFRYFYYLLCVSFLELVIKFLKYFAHFSHLSHKFHGKGSGKLKSEKRAQKDEDKMVFDICLLLFVHKIVYAFFYF